jgi:signal peptidase I
MVYDHAHDLEGSQNQVGLWSGYGVKLNERQSERRVMRNYIKDIIGAVVLAVAIFLVLHLVVGTYSVISESMAPGLQIGEHLVVNKMAYYFNEPDRGEIVYYQSPDGSPDQLKRVIGLPGDIVEVKDGAVYINGILLNEPYVKESPHYTLLAYQVLPNNYFILGDNRNNSADSSIGWTVPREDINGRAWIYLWPPDKWGGVDNYTLDTQLVSSENP